MDVEIVCWESGRSDKSRAVSFDISTVVTPTSSERDTGYTGCIEESVAKGRQQIIMALANQLPPATAHTVLLLPLNFTSFKDPSPILPIIRETLQKCVLESFTVLFVDPPNLSPHAQSASISAFNTAGSSSTRQKSRGRLYANLRRDLSTNIALVQAFLSRIYATLAAAQWGCGRVLMDVEVIFEGEALALSFSDLENGQAIRLKGISSRSIDSSSLD